MENNLWTEKYRPKTIQDYVFVDERQKQQVEAWIAEGIIPNLLLGGEPGVGKSALAKVLINELGINEYDVLKINASRENGVSVVREKISNFAQTMPFGKWKIVLLEEFDFTSIEFQGALRDDMEVYSSTVRFILTCNYQSKIIPAIRESRCFKFNLAKPDQTEFTARAATVLVSENIEFDLDTLDSYVRGSYPDLRKCLNLLQNNSKSGVLLPINDLGNNEEELLIKSTELFKAGKILEARQQLLYFISTYPTRAEDIAKWAYDNLDLWGNTNEKKDAAIIIIRNTLATLPLVGIPEISISAMLSELSGV